MNFLKGRFLLLAYFMFNLSLFVYAEPPIEVIYWQSSDVPAPSQKELDSFNDVMIEVQSFFASEMERQGFGEKTFVFKNIEVFKAKQNLAYYALDQMRIANAARFIQRGWDKQIWVVFLAGSSSIKGARGVAQYLCHFTGERLEECNNLVVITTASERILVPLVAHEIAHAFNLIDHADELWINDKIDVMYHPLAVFGDAIRMSLEHYVFNKKDATFLDNGGRLAVQEHNTEIIFDTDVNKDGYTDLSDVLIIRSAMSVENSYDTDVNNDGVTDILDLMIVKVAAFEAIAAAAPSMPRVITTTWAELKKR